MRFLDGGSRETWHTPPFLHFQYWRGSGCVVSAYVIDCDILCPFQPNSPCELSPTLRHFVCVCVCVCVLHNALVYSLSLSAFLSLSLSLSECISLCVKSASFTVGHFFPS